LNQATQERGTPIGRVPPEIIRPWGPQICLLAQRPIEKILRRRQGNIDILEKRKTWSATSAKPHHGDLLFAQCGPIHRVKEAEEVDGIKGFPNGGPHGIRSE